MAAVSAGELGFWENNAARAALLAAVLDRVPIPLEIGLTHGCGEQFVHSNAAAKLCNAARSPPAYRREDRFSLLPPDGSGWIGPLQVHLRVGQPLAESHGGAASAGDSGLDHHSETTTSSLQAPSPQLAGCLGETVRATADSAVTAATEGEPKSGSAPVERCGGSVPVAAPESACSGDSEQHGAVTMGPGPDGSVAAAGDASAGDATVMEDVAAVKQSDPESDHNVLHQHQPEREADYAPFPECSLPTRVPAGPSSSSGVETLAMQQELTLYRTVIQQLPMCVVVATSPEGAVRLASAKAISIWGADPVTCVEQYGSWPGFHADGTQYAATEWPLARSLLRGEHVDKELVRWRSKGGG